MVESVKSKKCVVCGKSFKTLSDTPLCSKECKVERTQKEINEMTDGEAYCPICGEEKDSVKTTLYHINESTKLEHKGVTMYQMKTCEYCGDKFRKQRWPHKNIFCSRECHIQSTQENSTEITFECKKDGCNNIKTAYNFPSLDSKPKYCSHECANSGKDHPNWQGGSEKIRKTPEYHQWRSKIHSMYNVCQECGSTNNLQAHHIVPVSKNKELATEISNGTLICGECHSEKHDTVADELFVN